MGAKFSSLSSESSSPPSSSSFSSILCTSSRHQNINNVADKENVHNVKKSINNSKRNEQNKINVEKTKSRQRSKLRNIRLHTYTRVPLDTLIRYESCRLEPNPFYKPHIPVLLQDIEELWNKQSYTMTLNAESVPNMLMHNVTNSSSAMAQMHCSSNNPVMLPDAIAEFKAHAEMEINKYIACNKYENTLKRLCKSLVKSKQHALKKPRADVSEKCSNTNGKVTNVNNNNINDNNNNNSNILLNTSMSEKLARRRPFVILLNKLGNSNSNNNKYNMRYNSKGNNNNNNNNNSSNNNGISSLSAIHLVSLLEIFLWYLPEPLVPFLTSRQIENAMMRNELKKECSIETREHLNFNNSTLECSGNKETNKNMPESETETIYNHNMSSEKLYECEEIESITSFISCKWKSILAWKEFTNNNSMYINSFHTFCFVLEILQAHVNEITRHELECVLKAIFHDASGECTRILRVLSERCKPGVRINSKVSEMPKQHELINNNINMCNNVIVNRESHKNTDNNNNNKDNVDNDNKNKNKNNIHNANARVKNEVEDECLESSRLEIDNNDTSISNSVNIKEKETIIDTIDNVVANLINNAENEEEEDEDEDNSNNSNSSNTTQSVNMLEDCNHTSPEANSDEILIAPSNHMKHNNDCEEALEDKSTLLLHQHVETCESSCHHEEFTKEQKEEKEVVKRVDNIYEKEESAVLEVEVTEALSAQNLHQQEEEQQQEEWHHQEEEQQQEEEHSELESRISKKYSSNEVDDNIDESKRHLLQVEGKLESLTEMERAQENKLQVDTFCALHVYSHNDDDTSKLKTNDYINVPLIKIEDIHHVNEPMLNPPLLECILPVKSIPHSQASIILEHEQETQPQHEREKEQQEEEERVKLEEEKEKEKLLKQHVEEQKHEWPEEEIKLLTHRTQQKADIIEEKQNKVTKEGNEVNKVDEIKEIYLRQSCTYDAESTHTSKQALTHLDKHESKHEEMPTSFCKANLDQVDKAKYKHEQQKFKHKYSNGFAKISQFNHLQSASHALEHAKQKFLWCQPHIPSRHVSSIKHATKKKVMNVNNVENQMSTRDESKMMQTIKNVTRTDNQSNVDQMYLRNCKKMEKEEEEEEEEEEHEQKMRALYGQMESLHSKWEDKVMCRVNVAEREHALESKSRDVCLAELQVRFAKMNKMLIGQVEENKVLRNMVEDVQIGLAKQNHAHAGNLINCYV